MSINQIIEGHYRNLIDSNSNLMEERIKICKTCKLYKADSPLGEICNNKLYLNPKTDEVSYFKKEGFKQGCGCMLRAKTRIVDAKCPINK